MRSQLRVILPVAVCGMQGSRAAFHSWVYLALCLQSPLNVVTLPNLSKNTFPLWEELAVYESSSILSYIGFIKPFPVWLLAFLH